MRTESRLKYSVHLQMKCREVSAAKQREVDTCTIVLMAGITELSIVTEYYYRERSTHEKQLYLLHLSPYHPSTLLQNVGTNL